MVLLADPPGSVTDEAGIVPTCGFEFVSFRVTELPPARGCGCKKFNSVSSTAGWMSRSVLPAPVVVSKEDRPIPDLARMKPEGASVTIALPVVNPGAEAV